MPCDALQTPCSVLTVSCCTPDQEVIPCPPKKKEQVQESCSLGPCMPTGCQRRLCQTLSRNFRSEVPRETQLCLPWAIKRSGGCSFLGHHRKGQFLLILRKRNTFFHLWGKQSLSAPSTLLGMADGKTEKQSKVCAPVLFPAACRKVSCLQLIFFLAFSWLLGKAKKNLEVAGGVIFPWVPPRRG